MISFIVGFSYRDVFNTLYQTFVPAFDVKLDSKNDAIMLKIRFLCFYALLLLLY